MSAPRSAWIRLVLAIAILASSFAAYLHLHRGWPAALLRDPSTIFYPLMLAGLALRLFWARYLVLCFCAGILGMQLAAGQLNPLALLGLGALVALLSGGSMQALFEGKRSRWNRWAAPARTTGRLKLAMLSQAAALGVLWPTLHAHPLHAHPLNAVALGLALAGTLALIGQRGWSLIPLLAACAVEGALAVRLGLAPERLEGPLDGARTAAILGAAVVVSVAVLLPALVRAWRGLARPSEG
jgi:hypothetical protein